VNTSSNQPGPPLWQIGTDGGLLDRPVKLSNDGAPGAKTLSLAPAERADVIVDFAGSKGQTLVLLNTANAPFPSGDPPDPETNGQVMQFRVNLRLRGVDLSFDPALPDATLRGGLLIHSPNWVNPEFRQSMSQSR